MVLPQLRQRSAFLGVATVFASGEKGRDQAGQKVGHRSGGDVLVWTVGKKHLRKIRFTIVFLEARVMRTIERIERPLTSANTICSRFSLLN